MKIWGFIFCCVALSAIASVSYADPALTADAVQEQLNLILHPGQIPPGQTLVSTIERLGALDLKSDLVRGGLDIGTRDGTRTLVQSAYRIEEDLRIAAMATPDPDVARALTKAMTQFAENNHYWEPELAKKTLQDMKGLVEQRPGLFPTRPFDPRVPQGNPSYKTQVVQQQEKLNAMVNRDYWRDAGYRKDGVGTTPDGKKYDIWTRPGEKEIHLDNSGRLVKEETANVNPADVSQPAAAPATAQRETRSAFKQRLSEASAKGEGNVALVDDEGHVKMATDETFADRDWNLRQAGWIQTGKGEGDSIIYRKPGTERSAAREISVEKPGTYLPEDVLQGGYKPVWKAQQDAMIELDQVLQAGGNESKVIFKNKVLAALEKVSKVRAGQPFTPSEVSLNYAHDLRAVIKGFPDDPDIQEAAVKAYGSLFRVGSKGYITYDTRVAAEDMKGIYNNTKLPDSVRQLAHQEMEAQHAGVPNWVKDPGPFESAQELASEQGKPASARLGSENVQSHPSTAQERMPSDPKIRELEAQAPKPGELNLEPVTGNFSKKMEEQALQFSEKMGLIPEGFNVGERSGLKFVKMLIPSLKGGAIAVVVAIPIAVFDTISACQAETKKTGKPCSKDTKATAPIVSLAKSLGSWVVYEKAVLPVLQAGQEALATIAGTTAGAVTLTVAGTAAAAALSAAVFYKFAQYGYSSVYGGMEALCDPKRNPDPPPILCGEPKGEGYYADDPEGYAVCKSTYPCAPSYCQCLLTHALQYCQESPYDNSCRSQSSRAGVAWSSHPAGSNGGPTPIQAQAGAGER